MLSSPKPHNARFHVVISCWTHLPPSLVRLPAFLVRTLTKYRALPSYESAAHDIVASFAGCAGQRCMAGQLYRGTRIRTEVAQIAEIRSDFLVWPSFDMKMDVFRKHVRRTTGLFCENRNKVMSNHLSHLIPTSLFAFVDIFETREFPSNSLQGGR